MLLLRLLLLFFLLWPADVWAAVAHRASAVQATTTATTTDTITIPASVATDDDLYVFITSRDHLAADLDVTVVDTDVTGNTWTLLSRSGTNKGFLFWKKATAATASKTITVALAQGCLASGVSAFSGGASGNPTADNLWETNSSGDETHTGFTPTNADSMVVFGIANVGNDNLVTVAAAATLGSFEPELWEILNTGGGDCAAWLGAVLSSGGPTATGDFTWSQTNSATRTLGFTIKPAAAAAAAPPLRMLMGVGK